MAGLYGVSAYQQTSQAYSKSTVNNDTKAQSAAKSDQAAAAKGSQTKVETKGWSPIDTKSSLVPTKTEYGMTIGDVQLSDKAKDYLGKLQSKFHGMEFITVSKDMKAQVQQNAAAYGNANKMVVLIDEEKLERMATDESFRKKYEGIIASSQSKMMQAKMGLSSSGSNVKNFGMSVDSNGKESFFATVGKSQDLQKKRIEKKAAEKKEQKIKEKKKAEKKAQEDRINKAKDSKAEKAKDKDDTDIYEEEEFEIIEANSLDDLLSKVQTYSYNNAASRVMTDTERAVGTRVDFKG
ncbi:hypothetical protein SAMN04487928_1752 [Butyrivibrio proteoclasticus]|uniref:Uncharacterized protein n=1 Tax=Butyrivibrio proteoclasticus TaxID=43305 RepID=A0A1I5Z1S4_9FIRM|nr:DUF6033 family protein [Butyrivibrio proteoclasticus]SFQ50382.1 hypothetical protein SAMN04487928_1752 [Butyrivibrio proteoclasticus]